MNYADELLYDTFNQTEAPYTSEALIALLQSSTSFATDKLIAFIGDASRKGMRLVLITSGGTATPLEKSAVRFIDNFSTGNRGAAAAECFLKQGDNLSPQYAVIFLYRRGSAMPFTRRIELYNLARSCIVSENDNVLLKDGAVARASTDLQSSQKRLFLIPYVTLGDYLLSLRALSAYVRQAGSSAMLFLAAAVSDFHVPYIELPVHKIQSADRELELKLRKVPKMLGVIAQRWMPEAFVVSFKLETNPHLLSKKVSQALEKYLVDAVVGNILETRYDEVTITTRDSTEHIRRTTNDIDIESVLVSNLIARHKCHIWLASQ